MNTSATGYLPTALQLITHSATAVQRWHHSPSGQVAALRFAALGPAAHVPAIKLAGSTQQTQVKFKSGLGH